MERLSFLDNQLGLADDRVSNLLIHKESRMPTLKNQTNMMELEGLRDEEELVEDDMKLLEEIAQKDKEIVELRKELCTLREK